MTRGRERFVRRALWTVYAIVAAAGLGLLAEALFVPRTPRPFAFPASSTGTAAAGDLLDNPANVLAERRMTVRIAAAPAVVSSVKSGPAPIEGLIRLTGIMDFQGKQPTLALIETPATNETKAYKSGDKVGDTGVVVREIKESVIVEYENRRFRVTYAGIREIPAAAVGARD